MNFPTHTKYAPLNLFDATLPSSINHPTNYHKMKSPRQNKDETMRDMNKRNTGVIEYGEIS